MNHSVSLEFNLPYPFIKNLPLNRPKIGLNAFYQINPLISRVTGKFIQEGREASAHLHSKGYSRITLITTSILAATACLSVGWYLSKRISPHIEKEKFWLGVIITGVFITILELSAP